MSETTTRLILERVERGDDLVVSLPTEYHAAMYLGFVNSAMRQGLFEVPDKDEQPRLTEKGREVLEELRRNATEDAA